MIRSILTSLLGVLLVGGCAVPMGHESPDLRRGAARMIPADAQVVASGPAPLSFVYPAGGGKVYLYDQTSDALLHTADLGPGNMSGLLILDAERKAFVGRDVNTDPKDDVILVQPIDPKHRFSIYFQPHRLKVEEEGGEHAGGDHAAHGEK